MTVTDEIINLKNVGKIITRRYVRLLEFVMKSLKSLLSVFLRSTAEVNVDTTC